VSYEVVGHPTGNTTICMNANDPRGCPRKQVETGGCGDRSCDLKIAWAGDFGGGGHLGGDPCPFIVKNVYNLRYTCSHDGRSKAASRQNFMPTKVGCTAEPIGEVTISCP
jgi:hypothetical protein